MGIPTDVAIGCFIKHAYADKNVDVDMILPHEINKERIESNDINFLVIYDLLESFHTDKTKDKRIYKELKNCLETCDNIFPPYKYQTLLLQDRVLQLPDAEQHRYRPDDDHDPGAVRGPRVRCRHQEDHRDGRDRELG